MTAEEISKARENYFQEFFATLKKIDPPKTTHDLKIALREAEKPDDIIMFKNIQTARSLACMLMQQVKGYDENMPYAGPFLNHRDRGKAYTIEIRPFIPNQ